MNFLQDFLQVQDFTFYIINYICDLSPDSIPESEKSSAFKSSASRFSIAIFFKFIKNFSNNFIFDFSKFYKRLKTG